MIFALPLKDRILSAGRLHYHKSLGRLLIKCRFRLFIGKIGTKKNSQRHKNVHRGDEVPPFSNSTEPILVIAICRHGIRAPNHQPHKLDKYNTDNQWKEGWGELLEEGMQQSYESGQTLRKRYGYDFVSETAFRSTELDRTNQSAQYLINGFYSNYADKKQSHFNNGINWKPIPVHTGGVGIPDPLLKPADYGCPKYAEMEKIVQIKLEEKMISENVNIFKYLEEKIGKGAGTLKQLRKLNDVQREVELKLDVDEWITKKLWHKTSDGLMVMVNRPKAGQVLKSTLDVARDIHFRWRNETLKGEMAYLQGGYILGDCLTRANNLITKTQENKMKIEKKLADQIKDKKEKSKNAAKNPKMVFYLSHDVTIMALSNLLELKNDRPIPQAGCFIIEVYMKHGKPYVQFVSYDNKKFASIKIPYCDGKTECDYKKFLERKQSKAIFTRDHLAKLCELDSEEFD